MAERPCPACGRPDPRHLKESSVGATCDYYRCEVCGHVWALFRNGRIHHVTALKSTDDEKRDVG